MKQLRVTDSELITATDMIHYEILTQEAYSEYCNLVNTNRWERVANTKEANEQVLLKAYGTETEILFRIPKICGLWYVKIG